MHWKYILVILCCSQLISVRAQDINLDSLFKLETDSIGRPCFVNLLNEFGMYDGFIVDSIKNLSESEKIVVAQKLLTFQDDKRLSGVKITQYVKLPDCQSYRLEPIPVQIRIEALYLINILVIGNYTVSPYPYLSKNGTIQNNIYAKKAFKYYKKWVLKIGKEGLMPNCSENNLPLAGKKIYWIGSRCK